VNATFKSRHGEIAELRYKWNQHTHMYTPFYLNRTDGYTPNRRSMIYFAQPTERL